MRELRVVGVETDGAHVICQDPESGEKFRVASDERLRAAARGDISRLGQIEIEMESALRPREIQARIRAGATVAEVAAIAGAPVDKIERFAHPVLLERTRAAELAGHAHPIRHDGPSLSTLDESVTEALMAYGQNPQDAAWDAWKGEDGYWVVQVTWQVGRSDNAAHWRFQPGSHGGTVDPLDDLADELSHPEWIAPRRRLTPVATPELTPPVDVAADGHEAVTVDANSVIGAQRARLERRLPDSDAHGTVPFDFDAIDDEPHQVPPSNRSDDHSSTVHSTTDFTVADPDPRVGPGDVSEPDAAPSDPTPAQDSSTEESAVDPIPAGADSGPADHKQRRRKSRKPAVPAWEDVLLGVRSNGSS
ncbi:septation protein SepH [Gordonia sp. ABSL49_1]|uniref:septation protein SepH n=1 Tax=Gordonia sp. ABSL49_1 TaxID=2920941 RepID=UPI001F0F7C92|nr:septation protein SepH [Gordonia sp. ABSL49_1]MCH5643177.1 septation protein SepH [Gordonia sp. ABSL49_1]